MSSTSWPTRFGMIAIVDFVDAGAVWVQQLSLRVQCVVSIVLRFAHTCGFEEFVHHAFVPLRGESGDGDGDGDGDQIARPSAGACVLSKSQIPRAKLVKDIHNLYEESKRELNVPIWCVHVGLFCFCSKYSRIRWSFLVEAWRVKERAEMERNAKS
jgi:hypothetical protein